MYYKSIPMAKAIETVNGMDEDKFVDQKLLNKDEEECTTSKETNLAAKVTFDTLHYWSRR